MEFLTALWLPILVSAVLVFVASSIIHMVLPIHRGDFTRLEKEDAVLEALRENGVAPGEYMFPFATSPKDMGTPEMQAKYEKGPIGWMTVIPEFAMGKNLAQWFAFSLFVGVVAGYIGWHGAGPGAPYLLVFRLTGAAAVACYAIGHCHDSIWKARAWSTTGKFVFDGIVYGVLTAGAFGWLWPD